MGKLSVPFQNAKENSVECHQSHRMQNYDSPTLSPAYSTAMIKGLSSTHLQSNQPFVFKTTLLLPSSTVHAKFVPTEIPLLWNEWIGWNQAYSSHKGPGDGVLFLRIKRQAGIFIVVAAVFVDFWWELSDNVCSSELESLQHQKPIWGSYFSRIIFFSKKS